MAWHKIYIAITRNKNAHVYNDQVYKVCRPCYKIILWPKFSISDSFDLNFIDKNEFEIFHLLQRAVK
jgi:hypothetical protein